jgi:hypothetical protein
MPTPKGPTIAEVAAEVAATLDGPIPFDEFAQRVLAIRPSAGKHPISQTKSSLRYELSRIGLAFADSAHRQVAPIHTILNGLTVTHGHYGACVSPAPHLRGRGDRRTPATFDR